RVYGLVVMTSTTESMMLVVVELSQAKCAMTASPRCGLVGLNPLISSVPLCPYVTICRFRVMPLADNENDGVPGFRSSGAGPAESVQLETNNAPASNPVTPVIQRTLTATSL